MKRFLIVAFMTVCVFGVAADAQTTEFTYQGKLTDGGIAANGGYDMQFKLFDDAVAGVQIGQTLTLPAVTVVQGIFTVRIDFGAGFDGSDRYMEIALRPAGNQGGYQQLLPRQRVTSAPYAIQSLVAATAALALDSTKLGGVDANRYVQTTDPRLSDSRDPTPGSGNYIQNRAGPQVAEFNVTGNGTVGSTFSANIVNSLSQFNIAGSRAFSYGNLSSIFIGPGAGSSNTTGDGNTFLGSLSGEANVDGFSNSFVGQNSGRRNTTGRSNTFFGAGSGQNNTVGNFNTFIGERSGGGNRTGSNLTLIGQGADVGAADLSFATAIGAGAVVDTNDTVVIGRILDRVVIPNSIQVFGELRANGSLLTDLNAANVTGGILRPAFGGTGLNSPGAPGNFLRSDGFDWRSSRIEPADVPDLSGAYIRSSVNQQAFANFNIDGDGSVGGLLSGGTVNAANQFNIGGARLIGVAVDSLFFGRNSGISNTNGDANSFFGDDSGRSNTTGAGNTFIGTKSGFFTESGLNNAFVGYSAGLSNRIGSRNTLLGAFSGSGSTTGNGNTMLGYFAGVNSTTGSENTFVGQGSGSQNLTGDRNTYVGFETGQSAEAGRRNTFLGYRADGRMAFSAIENSAASGAFAKVELNNSIVLGAINGVNGATWDTNVGIGTTTPGNRLHVVGDSSFIGNLGIGTLFPGVRLDVLGGNAAFNGGMLMLRGPIDPNQGFLYSAVVDGPEFRGFGGFRWVVNGGTEVMRLDSSGRIGLGTASPAAAIDLTVNGGNVLLGNAGCAAGFNGIGFGTGFSNCLNYSLLGNGTDTILNRPAGGTMYFREDNADQMKINPFGSVEILNTLSVARSAGIANSLTVGQFLTLGAIAGGGATQLCRNAQNVISTCSSSLRYKRDLQPYLSGLAVIRLLQPVSFRWIGDGSADVGFGAEAVAGIDPRLVTFNSSGQVEGVKYDRLSTVFVNAFKEQQDEIDAQRKRISELEKQIEALRALICSGNTDAAVCREKQQ